MNGPGRREKIPVRRGEVCHLAPVLPTLDEQGEAFLHGPETTRHHRDHPPPPGKLAAAILRRQMATPGSSDKPGFRRWYARQLYIAFAFLTTCLLSGVLVAAILEFVGLHTPGMTPLLTLTVLYFIGLLGVETFRRFWRILAHAQHCANDATCKQCGAYGLFNVVLDGRQIPATCRKCGNRWRVG